MENDITVLDSTKKKAEFNVTPDWVHAFTKLQKGDDETRRMRAQRGAFEDAFANDQDFALYFFMKMQEGLKKGKETIK